MDSPATPRPTQFFVWQDGQQEGPFCEDDLIRKVNSGHLSDQTLIWGEGMADWMALGLVFGMAKQTNAQASTPNQGDTSIVALTCESCGGRLDYCSGDDVAICPFCGSAHIIRQPVDSVQRLRDLEDNSLGVSYFTPTLKTEEAVQIIVRAIASEKAGFKNPHKLGMKVMAAFFPAWRIGAAVQSAWHGEYSETRTVVKIRRVTKSRQGGPSYEVDEPYNAQEITWHPRSGTQVFSTTLFVPAASGFSQQQLDASVTGVGAVGDKLGHPRSAPNFAVGRPSKTQSESWEEFRCDDRIDAQAHQKCRGCIERLQSVSSIVSSKQFSLIYLPVAIVSYSANGSEFRHFVNLRNGSFSGDLPLDDRSIRKECVAAGKGQKQIDRIKWFALLAILAELSFLLPFVLHWSDLFTDFWYVWLIVLAITLGALSHKSSPWQDFMWLRRAYLLRIAAHPPRDLEKQMHKGVDVESVRTSVRSMADRNALEERIDESNMVVLSHPANVLLRVASPLTAARVPSIIKTFVAAIVVLGALLFGFIYDEQRASKTIKPVASLPPTYITPAAPKESSTPPQPSPPSINPIAATPKPNEETSASSKHVEPSSPVDTPKIYKSPEVHYETNPRPQYAKADNRLLDAKADLAELNSTIESERGRWKAAVDVINKLTNFKRTPVREGSPAHLRCLEAVDVINEVERNAPEKVAKKARLEAIIKELEK